MPFASLRRRIRALLLSRKVRGLLVVVQTDELLGVVLPLEGIDRLVEVDGALRQHRNPSLPIGPEEAQRLRQLLAAWPW